MCKNAGAERDRLVGDVLSRRKIVLQKAYQSNEVNKMPQSNGLKIDARRKKILELLERDGKVKISELSRLLGTTVVTIRNDLDELEKTGRLERVQGGATLKTAFSGNLHGAYFERCKGENADLKKRIAAATASMVREGETVFINSGTTTFYTALELKKQKNLNIVTNSIYIAIELGDVPSFRVKLLGGDINNQYLFLYGNEALEQLRCYRADKTILSVSGICGDQTGITTFHAEEASLDRMMMERSREVVVVADSQKFGHEGFYHVASPDCIDKCVTNEGADREAVENLQKLGVEVILAH